MGRYGDLADNQSELLEALAGFAQSQDCGILSALAQGGDVATIDTATSDDTIEVHGYSSSTLLSLEKHGYLNIAHWGDLVTFELDRRAYDYAAYRSKGRLSRWWIDCTHALGQVDTFGSRLAWAFGTFVLSVAGAVIAAKLVP